jgi:flagellar protein FlbD
MTRMEVLEMIELTKYDGSVLLVNEFYIEFVEETPDTVVSLVNGKKIIVKESRQDIKNLVLLYKKCITE